MRVPTLLFLALLMPLRSAAQILDVRELNAAQIRALDPARTVVLLPGGILEEHGPYLPAYSDGYQTEYVTTRVAEAIVSRPGWTVLRYPPLPLGSMPANEIGQRYAYPGSYGVRMSTLRAVMMDLATDLGEAGFKWVFVLNLHGGPLHNRALDAAGRYFSETFNGRMVNLTGLVSVAGAVPRDLFAPAARAAEGFSVHADADEHSRMLFLRPGLVADGVRNAAAITGKDFADLRSLAGRGDWPGYFGTPAIATAAAGSRAMNAIASAAADAARQVLDGTPDTALPRVADAAAGDAAIRQVTEASLAHDAQVERRENEWIQRRP